MVPGYAAHAVPSWVRSSGNSIVLHKHASAQQRMPLSIAGYTITKGTYRVRRTATTPLLAYGNLSSLCAIGARRIVIRQQRLVQVF